MMTNQISFQDGKSPLMSTIIEFHDYSMTIIIFTMLLVGMLLFFTMTYNTYSNETAWASFLSIILISLASSSLWLLYELETSLTPKTAGHQWYWSYDYTDFNNSDFSSHTLPYSNLMMGQFRLLEMDSYKVIPWNSMVGAHFIMSDVFLPWVLPGVCSGIYEPHILYNMPLDPGLTLAYQTGHGAFMGILSVYYPPTMPSHCLSYYQFFLSSSNTPISSFMEYGLKSEGVWAYHIHKVPNSTPDGATFYSKHPVMTSPNGKITMPEQPIIKLPDTISS